MVFLNPCIDIAFKKIFGSQEHKRVTISFLNSILELTGDKKIQEVQFLNTEQLPLRDEKKENYLDILCTDQDKNTYIVEVQVKKVKSFDKRVVYYAAKTYALQLERRRPYTELKPVITISILDFVLFPDKKSHKSIHKFLDIKTHENDIQELSFAFVELPKFNKKEDELFSDEDKWLYFLKNINEQNHIPESLDSREFQEACNSAQRMKWSEQELNSYEYQLIKLTDDLGALELAEEKGIEKGKISIAKNLLDILDTKTIAEKTGLSTEEVEGLRKLY